MPSFVAPKRSKIWLKSRNSGLLYPERKPICDVRIRDTACRPDWAWFATKNSLQKDLVSGENIDYENPGTSTELTLDGFVSNGVSAAERLAVQNANAAGHPLRCDGDFTFICKYRDAVNTSTAYPRIFERASSGSGDGGYSIYRNGNQTEFRARFGGLSASSATAAVSSSTQKENMLLILRWDQSTTYLDVCGTDRVWNSGTGTYSASMETGGSKFVIGSPTWFTGLFEGTNKGIVLFRRFMETEEARYIAENFWQYFLEPATNNPIIFGSPLVSYSLTAENGTFTLTGQDANLLFGKQVTAESGTFALTGQDADLSFNQQVAAESGSFALSGQDATLTYTPVGSYSLTADSGTFALTGQTADLLVGKILTADQGSFTLAGQDATLTYTPAGAYTLPADSGTFALSGQASNLLFDRTLAADSGSITLTGQNANFLYGLTLAAESGSFSLTGQDADFLLNKVLAADQGSFALTGQDASLIYAGAGNYVLTADTGTYTVTGQDVRLFGYVVPAAGTSLELAQQAAMTVSIYAVLGESVTYIGTVDGTISIKAVVDRPDELFPGQFESPALDADVKARVQIADVPNPRREDIIVDARGDWYRVDSYAALNADEWEMEIRNG